jgi:hypothetical protein
MPEDLLRPLFEACRVEVRFNKLTNEAVCAVSLDEETVRLVNAALADGHSRRRSGGSCTDVFGAPGRARPASVQGRLAVSRQVVIEGGLVLPKSRWAKK